MNTNTRTIQINPKLKVMIHRDAKPVRKQPTRDASVQRYRWHDLAPRGVCRIPR